MIRNTETKLIMNGYSIKKYTDNYFKLVVHKTGIRPPGYEDIHHGKRDVNQNKLENNLTRAKTMIFEYSMCNDFDYFVTLTLNKDKHDRYDLPGYIKQLGQFIRDERSRTGKNIQYLLIPEKHKDGAYHMHGLISGISQDDLQVNRFGYLSWLRYQEKFGFISLGEIKSKEAAAKYMTKYVNKDIGNTVSEKNKKTYYVSRGLKAAEIIEKGTLSAIDKVPCDFENDYVRIATLNKWELKAFLDSHQEDYTLIDLKV